MSKSKKSIAEKHTTRASDTRSKTEKKLFESEVTEISKALQALIKYAHRQERSEHPDGAFDSARRWYPTVEEDCGVTRWARCPSRAFPFSYMSACRSLSHCEDLLDADHAVVLKAKKWVKEQAEKSTQEDFLVTAKRLVLTLEQRLLQTTLPLAPLKEREVARL